MSDTDQLISCPDCGASMSKRAPACVKCGAPNEELEKKQEEELQEEKILKNMDLWIIFFGSPLFGIFGYWLTGAWEMGWFCFIIIFVGGLYERFKE